MTPSDACPVCASAGLPIAIHERDGERWTCLSCRECACQYWYPRTVRAEFYADAHEDTYERRHSGERFLRPRHRLFLSRAKPGRLLDIGCGEGAFIIEAQDRGFEVAGIDLDARSIEIAASRGLARVRSTPLFETSTGEVEPSLREGRFEWVTAFEVLEHQAHPIEFLRAARALLAPRGSLCGSVPNRDRLFVERQRRMSSGDFPPHHFLWFSAETLQHTLRVAGFTEIRVLPVPEDELMPYAAYLEDAILGAITRSAKRTIRSIPKLEGSAQNRRRLMGVARTAKNLPFVPLAFAIRTALPNRMRSLYFEAR